MSSGDATGLIEPQPLDEWFIDLLACPACPQHWSLHLNGARTALICKCGRHSFSINDGIPNLLVEEATVIDENARPEDVKG